MGRLFHQHFFVCVLLFLSSCLSLAYGECDIHPQFWCDNADVAKQCGVFEQCQTRLLPVDQRSAPRVQLGLYYESLCPACRHFITTQLSKAFKEVLDIMEITLVPYGNAFEHENGDSWQFSCQHGAEECVGNILETCTINLVKNITVYFPFIVCMEGSQETEDFNKVAKECAKDHPVPIDQIIECSKSAQGNKMQHEMAMKTPKHQYVPWITVNGVHTFELENEAQTDLVALICKTYIGSPKPAVCTKA